MAQKRNPDALDGVVIIGNTVTAVQTALSLAQAGIEVKIVTEAESFGSPDGQADISDIQNTKHLVKPLLIKAACNPRITLLTNSIVESIEGKKGSYKLQISQRPRYVLSELCSGCKRCQPVCSARITSLINGEKVIHPAIHPPFLKSGSVPSTYVIEKNGIAPCQASCPLGINIQGFVSLLASQKVDKALALINEQAPLAGILGRVCKHPCEEKCNRAKADTAVSIRALHRFAADNSGGGPIYRSTSEPKQIQTKIGVIGSGPAGLMAAWELKRRGYSPTVFESHGVVGGLLATGIPRFRLPKEVREKEIEAIKNFGVDIRTGITVGRDISLAYLKERGYKVFFLAIGAQRNNKLRIPGEESDGVVDCMSLLLTLNLKVDTFVGNDVVIIGDGNSAVDSARAVVRSRGKARLLSWTVPEEITAASEEVDEAVQEGVIIGYQSIPIAIIRQGSVITGIRCQKTRLTAEKFANGRRRPEPIPGSDFIIEADRVVVAIGQSPDATQLGIEGLVTDPNSGVIKVNPVTLETSVPGIFAGGDCITGPNNVLDSMAYGLRAAESIDRFIQGRDLEVRRDGELPQTADVDLESIDVKPYERALMPVLPLEKRQGGFEETTTGFMAEIAVKESQRCLNCGLCSQCMECVSVCEAGAIAHSAGTRSLEIEASAVLKFPSAQTEETATATVGGRVESSKKGIYLVPSIKGNFEFQIIRAMAVAEETAIDISPEQAESRFKDNLSDGLKVCNKESMQPVPIPVQKKIGVFLCRCNGSIDSTIDFQAISRSLVSDDGVAYTASISQACTDVGASQIADAFKHRELDALLVAGCRCCNIDQICYSCSDRRRACLQLLGDNLKPGNQNSIEYVNIREQCAWLYNDKPAIATEKAYQSISAGVSRLKVASRIKGGDFSALLSVTVLGMDKATTIAAKALTSRGFSVTFLQFPVTGKSPAKSVKRSVEIQPNGDHVVVKSFPDDIYIGGSPGAFDIKLNYGSRRERYRSGSLVVTLTGLEKKLVDRIQGVVGRLLHRLLESGCENISHDIYRGIFSSSGQGIFIIPPESVLVNESSLYGLAVANRVSTFLEKPFLNAQAVQIDPNLCRGCGDCSRACPYIEMMMSDDGHAQASIDPALCLGCGLCIGCCPSGAIAQPMLSDEQIVASIKSLMVKPHLLTEIYE